MTPYNIMVVLADGFEDLEAVVTMDVLTRLGFKVTAVGLEALEVKAANKITVVADMVLSEVDFGNFDCVVLPGGMGGMTNLKNSAVLREELIKFYNSGKILAAICAAPIVLDAAGLLKGKDFTGYPGLEEFYTAGTPNGKTACTCDRIVTGLGPGATFAFAAEIAKAFGMGKAAEELYTKGMFVKL